MITDNIVDSLDKIQDQIDELLAELDRTEAGVFPEILATVGGMVAELLTIYADAHGKSVEPGEDLLAVFKAFVKGDPSLNAVRDNVREIVFYQNCLAENREDALPKNPAKMAVRTVQHIYFYLRSRLEQEQLLDQ